MVDEGIRVYHHSAYVHLRHEGDVGQKLLSAIRGFPWTGSEGCNDLEMGSSSL